MGNVKSIFFPRVNQFWKKSKDIKLNAYLNLFSYAKSEIEEELLAVIAGGEIPYIKSNKFYTHTMNQEKSISYVMGLYYEEFIHDYDKNFIESLVKNLRMRISVPIILLQESQQENTAIPVLCCGYDNKNKAFIIIDPKTGEFRDIKINQIYVSDGQKKMYMLNLPGMIEMHCIELPAMVNQAISMYNARFLSMSNLYYADKTGYESMMWIMGKNNLSSEIELIETHIRKQKMWITNAKLFETFLEKKILLKFKEIEKIYDAYYEQFIIQKL